MKIYLVVYNPNRYKTTHAQQGYDIYGSFAFYTLDEAKLFCEVMLNPGTEHLEDRPTILNWQEVHCGYLALHGKHAFRIKEWLLIDTVNLRQ